MEFIELFEPIVINGELEVENRSVLPALEARRLTFKLDCLFLTE
jgi:hypothetical protein